LYLLWVRDCTDWGHVAPQKVSGPVMVFDTGWKKTPMPGCG
jgi:hypothetical protein